MKEEQRRMATEMKETAAALKLLKQWADSSKE
jgi:hypothetical protein